MSHTAPTTDQVTAATGEATATPEPFADRLRALAQEIRGGGRATVQTHPLVPGWVYVLLALGAALGLVQYVRTSILEWLMVTRLAAGLSGLGVIVALLQNTLDSSFGLHGTGWGYVLAFLATFVLTFMTRVLYSRAKRADRVA